MASKPQIIAVQTAKRALKLTDMAYRTILRNAGGVESSKDLTNEGFDQAMAVMEESGFQSHPSGPTYWRNKAGGGRAAWLIRQLAAESRYDLAAQCLKFSDGRTDQPEQLTPQEAWKLTEMLKASNARASTPSRS